MYPSAAADQGDTVGQQGDGHLAHAAVFGPNHHAARGQFPDQFNVAGVGQAVHGFTAFVYHLGELKFTIGQFQIAGLYPHQIQHFINHAQ